MEEIDRPSSVKKNLFLCAFAVPGRRADASVLFYAAPVALAASAWSRHHRLVLSADTFASERLSARH